MKIEITKASGTQFCRGPCDKDPKYIKEKTHYFNDTVMIKGITCAKITIESSKGSTTAFYCRSCIDKIFLEMKMKLNPNLWALI